MKRAERGVNVVTLYVIGIFLLVALLLGYLLYAFRAEMIRKENRETLATQMTALVSNVDAQLVEMFERQIPQRIASRDVAVESLKHLAEASQPGTGEIRAVVQLLGEIKSAYALPDEV